MSGIHAYNELWGKIWLPSAYVVKASRWPRPTATTQQTPCGLSVQSWRRLSGSAFQLRNHRPSRAATHHRIPRKPL
jgi:hypothetical protein